MTDIRINFIELGYKFSYWEKKTGYNTGNMVGVPFILFMQETYPNYNKWKYDTENQVLIIKK